MSSEIDDQGEGGLTDPSAGADMLLTSETIAPSPEQVAALEAHNGSPIPNGTQVGDYVIERVLGEGGMGWVFDAVHPLIRKRVAVKLLKGAFASDKDVMERFVREARAVCEIGHRNIIEIFNFGTLEDGSPYYVMESLKGEELSEKLTRDGAMGFPEAYPILRQTFAALAAAHDAGIVHRDLKPENIYLCYEEGSDPVVKVLDFGIAKLMELGAEDASLTRTGTVMGSPAYMAPEQCEPIAPIGPHTDLYAMGMVMYVMFTGRLAFAHDTLLSMMHAQVYEAPSQLFDSPSPDQEALQELVLQCLGKKPEDRPESARAVLQALQDLAGGASYAAPPQTSGDAAAGGLRQTTLSGSAGERGATERRRSPAPIIAGIAAALALAVGGTMYLSGSSEPTAEPAPTQATKAAVAPPSQPPAKEAKAKEEPPPPPPEHRSEAAGITLDEKLVVKQVVADSPAHKWGIKKGMTLLAANDEPFTGSTVAGRLDALTDAKKPPRISVQDAEGNRLTLGEVKKKKKKKKRKKKKKKKSGFFQ